MSCGAIGKQKYTDSTLLEPTEAGKFEAVAITFKMDAKKNDRNEHEQKKRPLTSTPSVLGPILPILTCFLIRCLRSFYVFMPVLIEFNQNLATIDSCWYTLPF